MAGARPQPDGPPPPPTVQRVRLQMARRGRLRFTSHRDTARMLERAVRRAGLPIAHSAGFSPHPRISYVGACPTGVASEAEYLEIGLTEVCDPELVRAALDAALPPGLDMVAAAAAVAGEASLADRIAASVWRIRLPGVAEDELAAAVAAFLAAESVLVQRRTKDGTRELDARAAVVSLRVGDRDCDTLGLVVRHSTPAVRPDDVLAGLRCVADLVTTAPPEAMRLAQGLLADDGELLDPLAPQH